MYEVFESQRGMIPEGRFSEIRYEDLVAAPVEQMGRIYDELNLGGFDDARPALEEHAAGMAGYKKNRFELPAETREEIGRRWGWFMDKYGYER
ncbi:MAG: sulfotransferase, partial [Pirellulaceae bacterium]|nr:sulfotransferase [Pirellulaceae bacterium]